jgi:hypothetical protein
MEVMEISLRDWDKRHASPAEERALLSREHVQTRRVSVFPSACPVLHLRGYIGIDSLIHLGS